MSIPKHIKEHLVLEGAGLLGSSTSYKNSLVLKSTGVPYGICPTNTVVTAGNPGTIVLGTALWRTFSDGIYLYFPATGSMTAGFYLCTMSSTTAGVLTGTNVATGGTTTAVTSKINLATVAIPGGLIGANGNVEIHALYELANSANNKTFTMEYDTVTINTLTGTTSASLMLYGEFFNGGIETQQVIPATGTGDPFLFRGGTAVRSSIDSSSPKNFYITGQTANGVDWIILEAYKIVINRAA